MAKTQSKTHGSQGGTRAKRASSGVNAPRTYSPETVPAEIEQAVGVTVDELTALYVLDGLKGFGPQKFKEIHTHRLEPAAVVSEPALLPTVGKRGDDLRKQLEDVRAESGHVCRARAAKQILTAHQHGALIVTYRHPLYPTNVFESNYPAPILFVRGAPAVLQNFRAVACVGSRKTRPPYSEFEKAFVNTACLAGFTVVSGFALGADTIGHEQAWKSGGTTVCVMPGGLERPFPPENRWLWDEFLSYNGAVFVSELGFGVRASALTLRKRNKLIVAFAQGVLVAQSAKEGGAMNAFRFALEQKKPVATFAPDDSHETSGNLLISVQPGATTWAVDRLDHGDYEAWLRQLSSSMSTEPSGTVNRGSPKSWLD